MQRIGTVSFFKQENLWYTACPTCNKKVIESNFGGNSSWRCEKCNKDLPDVRSFPY